MPGFDRRDLPAGDNIDWIHQEGDSQSPSDTESAVISHRSMPEDTFSDTQSAPPASGSVPDAVARFLRGIVPARGDTIVEMVRKCVFFAALITLIGSLSYIAYDMLIQPAAVDKVFSDLASLYDPNNPVPPPADYAGGYPKGIQDFFKPLYARNQDVRGWISYYDSQKSWLNINYPVMYSGDNSYYLYRDFYKVKSKSGVPFFDMNNDISSPAAANKVLIVYGHNMMTGSMFSRLNNMLSNLNQARNAPLIDLNTLYRNGQYKVFAVVLTNTETRDGPVFRYLRTSFGGDKDFMDYAANVRARSIYDYENVDILPDDELLILSTCTPESTAKFKDGRCVIFARRVRDGESTVTRPSEIVNNSDVIMPRAWYEKKNLPLHEFYTNPDYVIPGLWDTNSSTPGSTGTYPNYTNPNYTHPNNTLPADPSGSLPDISTAPGTPSGSSSSSDSSSSSPGSSSSSQGSSSSSSGGSSSSSSGSPSSGTSTATTTTATEPDVDPDNEDTGPDDPTEPAEPDE